ncbi:hypothetical protein C8R45DRAFT_989468 [Mycena sanguinolenta]|nr:hypothetical protein C8R45DRAFT_989468 [Mycena sanguinolenta]
MRVSAFSVVVTAASMVLAAPAPLKRQADSSIICPAADKTGSALSAQGSLVDEGNEFSQCVYPVAGTCTYFFADGTFSSGSSKCPVGLPQTAATGAGNAPTAVNAAGGGGQQTTTKQAVTTTNTPPPVATTSSTVAPAPPVTTQSTEAPPPVTTQSTEAPVVTSTQSTETPPTTSTSTLSLTVQAPTTSAPVVPPTTPATSVPQSTVTVNVNVTAAPTNTDSGTTPLGAAGSGNTSGAVVRHAGSALAVLPILCVLFSLL